MKMPRTMAIAGAGAMDADRPGSSRGVVSVIIDLVPERLK